MSRIAVYFLVAVFCLAGCSGTSEDETVGWSAQRLYGEAKDAMASKDWPRAVKYLEKLEARYPYGRFAQQSQLEIAYCNFKDGERATAIAAVDRFIKLYPNHANIDHARPLGPRSARLARRVQRLQGGRHPLPGLEIRPGFGGAHALPGERPRQL